jgi:hypothetical protein
MMKFKINNTILINLLIAFILLAFIQFGLNISGTKGFVALIVLVLLFLSGITLFYSAYNLLIKVNILEATLEEKENKLIADENDNSEKEKSTEIEKELDIEAIIPQSKTKLNIFCEELLKNFSESCNAVQSIMYIKDNSSELYKCISKFAYYADNEPAAFKIGETLPGQAVKNKKIVTVSNIPENYMVIASGLGNGNPGYLTFIPLIYKDEVIGLIEYASFAPNSDILNSGLSNLSEAATDIIIKLLKK